MQHPQHHHHHHPSHHPPQHAPHHARIRPSQLVPGASLLLQYTWVVEVVNRFAYAELGYMPESLEFDLLFRASRFHNVPFLAVWRLFVLFSNPVADKRVRALSARFPDLLIEDMPFLGALECPEEYLLVAPQPGGYPTRSALEVRSVPPAVVPLLLDAMLGPPVHDHGLIDAVAAGWGARILYETLSKMDGVVMQFAAPMNHHPHPQNQSHSQNQSHGPSNGHSNAMHPGHHHGEARERTATALRSTGAAAAANASTMGGGSGELSYATHLGQPMAQMNAASASGISSSSGARLSPHQYPSQPQSQPQAQAHPHAHAHVHVHAIQHQHQHQ
jgi:hypothetical protein